MKNSNFIFICLFILFLSQTYVAKAQPELMAWRNLTGIRVEGQLMDFETSLRVVKKGWTDFEATGREKQRPGYDREGMKQTVNTNIKGISFIEVIDDCGKGCAGITLNAIAEKDTIVEGVFFCIDLPSKYFQDASIRFTGTAGKPKVLSSISPDKNLKPFHASANGISVSSAERKLDVSFGSKSEVFIRSESSAGSQIYIRLLSGNLKKGQEIQTTFKIRASGNIDNSPVELVLDSQNPGRRFDGLGGNFRLQNPKTDPPVIDYCLNNLRVSWGRVEMPWGLWHQEEGVNPIEAAKSGKIHPHVHASMNMARRLDSIGMPVIISAWSAPAWAILGDPMDAFRFRSKGIYGYQLNPEKTERIYKSIGDYIEYLKLNYGVEAVMFSFNESDLGINVRHTGDEHAEFIKGLGAHLSARGLATRLLLGDNSDATTFDFIVPAMNDPETHKYIGAVSFHSWRGCTDVMLKKWNGAAKQLNLPLIIGEGSTDAAAWNYPEIFSEQSFAFYEINLYIRICALSEPLSILQWQLTADYSLLTGAGVFGTTGPLKPTQRFWNLKQLASTPPYSFSLPVTSSKESINCAAFGNISRGEYAVHIVNNGAERQCTIKGIPQNITSLEVYVTNQDRNMEKTGSISVSNGTAEFKLLPFSFVSVFGM